MPQFASVSSLGQHPALGQVPLDAKLEDISPISATEVGMCWDVLSQQIFDWNSLHLDQPARALHGFTWILGDRAHRT